MNGKKIRRVDWPEQRYLWWMPPAVVKAEWCREPHLKELAEANGGEVTCLGTWRFITPHMEVMTGWTPSDSDVKAIDWVTF